MVNVEIVTGSRTGTDTVWFGELPFIPRKGELIVYGKPYLGMCPSSRIKIIQWLFHRDPVTVVIYI